MSRRRVLGRPLIGGQFQMTNLTRWLMIAAAILGMAGFCWAGTKRKPKPLGVVKAFDVAVRELRRSNKYFKPEENRIEIERGDGGWHVYVERVGTAFKPYGSETWVSVWDNGRVDVLPGL